MADASSERRWVECKFSREELNDKSVEYLFAVDGVRGNGVFAVDQREDGLLSIVITVEREELVRLYLHQMMAYLIKRNPPDSRFEFQCIQSP